MSSVHPLKSRTVCPVIKDTTFLKKKKFIFESTRVGEGQSEREAEDQKRALHGQRQARCGARS